MVKDPNNTKCGHNSALLYERKLTLRLLKLEKIKNTKKNREQVIGIKTFFLSFFSLQSVLYHFSPGY